MEFQFKISKHYLLAHTLGQYESPFKDWKKFRDNLQKKIPRSFYLFSWHPEGALIGEDFDNKLESLFKETKILFNYISRSPEFQKLYDETKKYLFFVKNQWKVNEKEALKIIRGLSGIDLSDKKISVFITHPKLRNGVNFPPFEAIGWGHPEDWKNYSTVYLCHELMHLLVENKQKNEQITHAIIELMIDNELRIRLNKKGIYFKEGKHNIGHPYLRQIEEKILPYWRKYLKQKKKDVFKFEKEVSKILKNKKRDC